MAALAAEDAAPAEPRLKPWEYRFDVGIVGGGHFFYEPHGLGRARDDDSSLSPAHNLTYGLRFGFHLSPAFTLEAEGLAALTYARDRSTDLWVYQYGGQLLVHPWLLGPVQPFALVGYGAMASWVEDKESVLKDDQDGMARVGLGAKVHVTDRIGLRLEARLVSSLAFAADVLALGEETAYYGPDWQALASLFVNLGVIESRLLVKEKVVMAPPPPDPDPDRDGIAGAADACPNIAEDKDGFEDEDGCPESDNDKDGIPDAMDKCPLEAETKNDIDDEDGCPEKDLDGDGFIGSRDACPNEPETVNGFKDNDGCPDELPPEVQKFTGVIQGINFKTNSAQLLRNSHGILDKAILVLRAYPDIRLEIQGHTDNRGKPDYNRDLSQKRAESVRAYFIKQGISAERLVAIGYGQDKPIADNKTAAGRSKNRRTEFQVLSDTPK